MNKVAEEINEMLQEKSKVTISELTNLYELPSEFLNQVFFIFKVIILNI